MAAYQFPKKFIDSLAAFSVFSPEQLAELSEFLEENLESLGGPDATFDMARGAKFKTIDPELAFRVLDTVVPLVFSTSGTAETKRAVDDVVRAFAATQPQSKAAELKAIQRKLRKNIGALFENPRVRLKSKAMRLLTTHEKAYQDCEIVSDIRPVFSADGKVSVEAAVLFHTLRIGHGSEGDSVYIAMDAADLRKLKEAVERAITKEQSLAKLLARAGVEHIKVA